MILSIESAVQLATRHQSELALSKTDTILVLSHHLLPNVRFGSKADMCAAKTDVRFTPNSDRECGLPQKVMSALLSESGQSAAQTRCQLGANSGQKRTRAARPKVSSYPFFADREGKNLFAPTWLEVEHPMRIRNNGRQGRDRSRRPVGKRGGHRALIGSASSVQTHRKSGARFGGTNRDSSPFWR